jgi:hypothetical protein
MAGQERLRILCHKQDFCKLSLLRRASFGVSNRGSGAKRETRRKLVYYKICGQRKYIFIYIYCRLWFFSPSLLVFITIIAASRTMIIITDPFILLTLIIKERKTSIVSSPRPYERALNSSDRHIAHYFNHWGLDAVASCRCFLL